MANHFRRLISAGITAAMLISTVAIPVGANTAPDGWTYQFTGSVKATATIDTAEHYSGKASLKVVNTSPQASNVYFMAYAKVKVEKGKKYTIGAKIKSNNSKRIGFVITQPHTVYTTTTVGNTFNWTNYQFTYTAPETRETALGLLVEGESDGVWYDDILFIDVETGENLITNPGFETGGNMTEEEVQSDAADGLLVEVYNTIQTSDVFSEEAMEKVRGAFKFMPVYKAEGITIDGDSSDWENYPALSMPTLPAQYQVYMNDGKAKDVMAECRFAQDDNFFYFVIDVKDDNYTYYTTEDNYWRGDSIQLTISDLIENYGQELGLVHDPETNSGRIFGSGFNDNEKGQMTLKTSQNEGITTYEFKFPWAVKFYNGMPKKLMFNFLVNDNDGDGRRYCAELAPGISEGKTNAQFPVLEIFDGQKDWYAWIQGTRECVTEDPIKYDCYIVNSGVEKTFTYKNSMTGETETITVPEASGVRRSFETVYDTAGTYTVEAEIECNGEVTTSGFTSIVERRPPDVTYAEKFLKKLTTNSQALKVLIDKCEAKDIPTDYERVNYTVLDKFVDFVKSDIEANDLVRIYYTEETTDAIYEEAKANLEAYLSGEKEAVDYPNYVTSESVIDGISLIAEVEVDGKTKEQPVFFVGYGHGSAVRPMISTFNETLGMNTIQLEMGPSHVMTRGNAWTAQVSNDPKVEHMYTNEVVHSGENALLIKYNDQVEANHFISYYQNIPVEEGETYVLSGWVKADKAEHVWVSSDGWDNINYLSGTYDWKEFSIEYTMPLGKKTANVRICIDDAASALYFDELSFIKKGTEEELLNDGGFEIPFEDARNYSFNEQSSQYINLINDLENAEKNNVAFTLLISPHYFVDSYSSANGFKISTPGFLNYNVNDPKAREFIGKYLRELISRVKDYDSIHSICITNEPQMEVSDCGDFYLPDWHEYLKEVYGNDINLLNRAYKTEYTSFDEIDLQNSAEAPAKHYDYKVFNDKMFAQWHKFMADTIREIAPDIPLHCKIMAYLGSDSGRTSYHNNGTGYGEYYEIFDFHGSDAWNYYNNTAEHDKKMWYDYQMSFGDYKPIINSEDHIVPDNFYDYSIQHGDYMALDIWQGAVHGRAVSDIWWWTRAVSNATKSAIGNVLYRPDAVANISHAALDLNRYAYEITALQYDEREIGIIYSDASAISDTSYMGSCYQAYASTINSGKRCLFITDWNYGMIDTCKMVIVPHIKYISDEVLGALKSYVDKGGKVIIFGNDLLTMDEHTFEHDKNIVDYIYNNATVVSTVPSPKGDKSHTIDELSDIIRDELEKLGLINITVIDTATDEPAYDIEYNVGACNGRLIINLANYGVDRTFKVYAGDKLITGATELRSGEVIGDEVTVNEYEVALLAVEMDNLFIDTYGHWGENEISNLKSAGIVNGVSETRYVPNATTTRAEFLALLLRASGIAEAKYDNEISDVRSNDWFAGVVSAAFKNGVIENIAFRPNDKITREEMCTLLVKCAELNGDLENGDASFTDNDKISDSVTVGKAVKAGFMQGRDDGSFEPDGNATRAEAAAVIWRYVKD